MIPVFKDQALFAWKIYENVFLVDQILFINVIHVIHIFVFNESSDY